MPEKHLYHYLTESDSDQKEKAQAWAAGIGLQKVDGLQASAYLVDIAQKNIAGDISMRDAHDLLNEYYSAKRGPNGGTAGEPDSQTEAVTREADLVAANIAEILLENAFVFSSMGLLSTHGRIFRGVFSHAGKIRDYNITKKEWVLAGDTVIYAPASELLATLNFDIGNEKEFKYAGLSRAEFLKHLANFIAGLWQIHPFREGNTRAIAVFMAKRLKTLNLNVDNRPFAENSWYFRNALVRANYANPAKGINATTEYLIAFLENALFGANHELKNRNLRIRV